MTDEIEKIRERHENASKDDGYDWHVMHGLAAHADRATLLSALDAAEARAVAAEEMLTLWEQFFDKHVAPEPMFFKPEVGVLLKEIARFRAPCAPEGETHE